MTDVQLYPPDAEARLGFDTVRERLASHARTPYGAEALAALRPSSDAVTVRARLARAGEMTDLLGFDDPFPLATSDDVRPTLARLRPKDSLVDGADLAALGRVLAVLRLVHDYLHARKSKAPGLWGVAERIVVLKALEDRIARTLDEGGHVRDDASPLLSDLTRRLASLGGRLRETLNTALRAAIAQGWATESQPTIRGGRAVIPVRAEAKRKVQGFVHDVSASGQTVFIEPASVLDLNNEIRELEIERAREVERILRELSGHARHHTDDVRDGLDALGRLDATAAAARLALETGALVPDVGEGGPLRLVGARHVGLVLREAKRPPAERRAVVPLTLSLGDRSGDPDLDRRPEAATCLVVTGPNAGGKSVVMKTVGLTTLMAAYGLPVPAAPGTRIALPTQIFVDVGDQQSIQDDLSTFTSHLTHVAAMLERADDRSLCLLDEAGTGTDPAEGGALAEAVLRRLTARGAHTVATTHVGALKAFA
ncbi:MAG TPA: endonuclease MutS2, partial [Rubricoccaceae bacterium]